MMKAVFFLLRVELVVILDLGLMNTRGLGSRRFNHFRAQAQVRLYLM